MNVFWIAQRELRAIFNTAVGWLVLTSFLLVTGVFWLNYVDSYVAASADLVFNPYTATQLNLSDHLIELFFGDVAVILLMVAPALSMRLFSEEFQQQTIELLLTSPLSTAQIVLGKYLGAVGYLLVMLLCTAHFPISLMMWGEPELGAIFGGYLALFLLCSTVLAFGLWFSSFTSNQIVAFVLTLGMAILLWVGWAGGASDAWTSQISFQGHVFGIIDGALRLSDLVYFGGMIGFFLFATHQRLESFRWS